MLDLLYTLQAVSRYGTFAAAGARLGITQSAVSMQLKKLEELLGYCVLDRSGRKAAINEDGRKVLSQMQQVDVILSQMKRGIADNELAGLLKIGSISTSLLSDIPQAVGRLRARLPQVELHITPGTSPDLLQAVEEGRLDAAVLVKPAHPIEGRLQWQQLRQEEFVLIAPAHVRQGDTKALLSNSPFIRYDRHSFGGALVDRYLKRQRIKVSDPVEVDSIEAIALLVAAGQGVAIVPFSPCLKQLPLALTYIRLHDGGLYRSIGMVSRDDGLRSHLVTQFWQSLSPLSEPLAS